MKKNNSTARFGSVPVLFYSSCFVAGMVSVCGRHQNGRKNIRYTGLAFTLFPAKFEGLRTMAKAGMILKKLSAVYCTLAGNWYRGLM